MRFTRPTFTSRARTTRSVLGGVCLALGLAGCGGESVKPFEPVTDPARVLNRLKLNIGAVNLSMAPSSNTFQLIATPISAQGEPMEGLPAPTFFSTDTTTVQVSPTGLLTAVGTATGVIVITKLITGDNIVQYDTAFVNVNSTTDPAPQLATLSVDPPSPDKAVVSIAGLTQDLVVFFWVFQIYPDVFPALVPYLQETTADGTPIPDLTTEYLSLDPTIAAVDRRTGDIFALAAGQARLVARTAAYGVVKADTALFTITPPSYQKSLITKVGDVVSLGPATVIRQGGAVYFADGYPGPGPVSLEFDDPTATAIPPASICDIARTGGDFGDFVARPRACDADFAMDTTEGEEYRIRTFPNSGTFTYHDILSGATGRIIVMDSTTWLPASRRARR